MLKKLTEPYVVGVGSRFLGQMISFAAVVIASRFLDLQAFGTYSLAWAVAVIANTFVFTGFYQALLRSTAFERDRDSLFWLMTAVGATGSVIILGIGLAAGGLSTPTGWALCALAPQPFLIVPIAWWEAQLVRARRARAASLYVVAAETAGLAAAFAMLHGGWGIEALVASRYVSTAVGLALTGGLVRALPRLTLNRETRATAGRTAYPLWGTSSVGMFSNYGADLILGAFLHAVAVGAYRGGARIAVTASDLVLQPLMMLSWSRFTRLEKENAPLGDLRRAWLDNMGVAAAILWPVTASIALLAPTLVVTILDETWLPAAGVVSILSASRAVSFLTALLEPTMMCTGRPATQLRIRGFGALALLALLLIFGRHGAEAAAFAHLGASVMVATVALVAMMRALGISGTQLAQVFLPGLVLTLFTVLAILFTDMPRDALGRDLGLAATLGAIVVVWGAFMAVFLHRRVLVLPTP